MTTIYINPDIVKKAKELGINVSQACENALRLYIAAIENANQKITQNKGGFGTVGSEWWTGRDLNPRPPECESIDWDGFEKWLLQRVNANYVQDLLRYAREFYPCLENGDLSSVVGLSEGKRRMVLAALGNLAKFMGVYDGWRQVIRRFDVKWQSVEVKDKRVIERISRRVDIDAVYGWVRTAKQKCPVYADFLDFIALTGLRLNEAMESWNLLKNVENLSQYYNVEKECLEHFRFKERFLRRGKKAFISFVPRELVVKIRQSSLTIGSRHTLAKHVGKARFSDLREAWASIMTKSLNQNEIDFLQGRVGTSVFMQNYYNPALIADLKERVFKGIEEIWQKIK